MISNSSSIIQNNALTENNTTYTVYFLLEININQLNRVTFTQNIFMKGLLDMRPNSRTMTQNNSLTVGIVSFTVYVLSEMSTIKLNNVAFTQNNLINSFLHMALNSRCYNPEKYTY